MLGKRLFFRCDGGTHVVSIVIFIVGQLDNTIGALDKETHGMHSPEVMLYEMRTLPGYRL